MKFFNVLMVIAMAFLASVSASSHVIDVINNCHTPTTVQLPGIGVFGAGKRTINGDVRGGIAQACSDINGVGCNSVEFTLVDGVSSADITLIPPHRFDVSCMSLFEYSNLLADNLITHYTAQSFFLP
jgi:hypothetical protein